MISQVRIKKNSPAVFLFVSLVLQLFFGYRFIALTVSDFNVPEWVTVPAFFATKPFDVAGLMKIFRSKKPYLSTVGGVSGLI